MSLDHQVTFSHTAARELGDVGPQQPSLHKDCSSWLRSPKVTWEKPGMTLKFEVATSDSQAVQGITSQMRASGNRNLARQ